MPIEITLEMRQRGAEQVAEELDRSVRRASQYGHSNVAGFDETLAYTGIAHALSVWWSNLPVEEVDKRLKHLLVSTKAAYFNQKADVAVATGASPTTVQ